MTEVDTVFTTAAWVVLWIGCVTAALGCGAWLMTLDWPDAILSPIDRILVFGLGFGFFMFTAVTLAMVPDLLRLLS
ncbi:hypothetical protein [Marinivivus vitaminiproducens]|uniref:hypothetical protein n=1 Tax=Marinivivus vitaminiproducens TaxID=3035935 RepID=UPI00279A95C2|nr:hypothetical protein P4R82_24825 [Geminicoccaceae bacterium SCSIO 64248]